MSEQEAISQAEILLRFLTDPSVQMAFQNIEDKYYREFKSSLTPESRDIAWAKARVIDDFKAEMQVVVDAGTRAVKERQDRERKEEAAALVSRRRKRTGTR
jgi:hypothetical protein